MLTNALIPLSHHLLPTQFLLQTRLYQRVTCPISPLLLMIVLPIDISHHRVTVPHFYQCVPAPFVRNMSSPTTCVQLLMALIILFHRVPCPSPLLLMIILCHRVTAPFLQRMMAPTRRLHNVTLPSRLLHQRPRVSAPPRLLLRLFHRVTGLPPRLLFHVVTTLLVHPLVAPTLLLITSLLIKSLGSSVDRLNEECGCECDLQRRHQVLC